MRNLTTNLDVDRAFQKLLQGSLVSDLDSILEFTELLSGAARQLDLWGRPDLAGLVLPAIHRWEHGYMLNLAASCLNVPIRRDLAASAAASAGRWGDSDVQVAMLRCVAAYDQANGAPTCTPHADVLPGEGPQVAAANICPPPSEPAGGVILQGTLSATISVPSGDETEGSYSGSGSLQVVVSAPSGLDHAMGQQGGTISISGTWSGACVGTGSSSGALSDWSQGGPQVYEPDGKYGQQQADGRYLIGQLSVTDHAANVPSGALGHGQKLFIDGSVQIAVDASCGHQPGGTVYTTTVPIYIDTCVGGEILDLTGPGQYSGSCETTVPFVNGERGTVHWTGEIHQVTP